MTLERLFLPDDCDATKLSDLCRLTLEGGLEGAVLLGRGPYVSSAESI